jgi:hypothetical protein
MDPDHSTPLYLSILISSFPICGCLCSGRIHVGTVLDLLKFFSDFYFLRLMSSFNAFPVLNFFSSHILPCACAFFLLYHFFTLRLCIFPPLPFFSLRDCFSHLIKMSHNGSLFFIIPGVFLFASTRGENPTFCRRRDLSRALAQPTPSPTQPLQG